MLARNVLAQGGYPNKQIRMVVPFAAAGTTDLLGRIVAQYLTEVWGQQVIVDNKTGAGGNVGAELVAKAPPTATRCCWARSAPPSPTSISTRTCPTTA